MIKIIESKVLLDILSGDNLNHVFKKNSNVLADKRTVKLAEIVDTFAEVISGEYCRYAIFVRFFISWNFFGTSIKSDCDQFWPTLPLLISRKKNDFYLEFFAFALH